MLSRYRDSLRLWTDPMGRLLFRVHLRPNQLTVCGFGVSVITAAVFASGRVRVAGVLLILAGFCDYFDGSLARASGRVTPFGGFLDSVIDRYSDLVVFLGIVLLFVSAGNGRATVSAMVALVGTVMVSYTKARAESIGITCNVGFMERPERMICLIAGSVLDLLEPAVWTLAVLTNATAVHRIAFTRRAARRVDTPGPILRAGAAGLILLAAPGFALAAAPTPAGRPSPEVERRWADAVEALRQGDPGPAVREFATPEAAGSLVADYLQYVQAEALLGGGDVAGARRAAEALAERFRGGRVGRAALLLAAYAADRAGDEVGNEALVRRFLQAYPDSAETPAVLYQLAASFDARGQRENAAQTYRQLTLLAPASEYADGAADRLHELERAGASLPPPPATERLARAERLLRAGRAEPAREEAETVAAEATDRDLALRALTVAAAALGRLRRYEAASILVERALARAPAGQQPALRLELGRLLYRAGKDERALAALAGIDEAREAEAADAGYLRGQILEDLARFDEARAAYEQTVARFPSRESAASALWRLGWLAYLRNDRADAVARWSRLDELAVGLPYKRAAAYWAGRVREEMGAAAEAASLYERARAAGPRSYYGLLAAVRLGAAPVPETPAPLALPDDPAQALADDPDVARIDILWRLGLSEYAGAEMEDLALRSITDPVKLFWLATAYRRQERYHLALRVLRRHFAEVAASGHPALPRTFWEAVYPIGWGGDLTEAADHAGLDRFLVAAVVREESSFYPLAQSRAGARGLMQLLPQTARTIALHRGVDLKGGGALDEPGPNLRLGTAMLGDLLKQFADPRLAIAAYNAGPGRVREWWAARRTSDVEAFLEQIPYEETRVYVKRVVVAWEEYRRLYGTRPGR